MRFSAPWDSLLKLLTPLVCLLPAAIAVLPPYEPLWTLLLKLMLVNLGPLCWLFSPRGYSVARGALLIHRPIGTIRIPLTGHEDARLVPASELKGALRTFGVGGCFGYYGRFQLNGEAQRWYLTDRARAVRLATAAGVLLVSPADPAAFLKALHASGPGSV